MQRITQVMLAQKQCELGQVLAQRGISEVTLHHGDKATKVTNKLVINKTNVWPDAMGGYTTRDAYNAMRLMISTLSAVDD